MNTYFFPVAVRFAAALIGAILTAALPVFADSAPPGAAKGCDAHPENLAVYEQVHQHIFNDRDLARVEEFFAEDFTNHNAPPGAAQGPAAIRQYLPLLAGAFPDRAVIVDFVLCAGDFVIARTFVTGTNTGSYFGRAPTGKSFDVTGTDIYFIRDGKIAGRWGNEDSLGLWRQLGLIGDVEALPESKD